MTLNGICNTVTALVPQKAQMCSLMNQHVTGNQLFLRSVYTDPVIAIITIITSRHLGYNKPDITVELVALLLGFQELLNSNSCPDTVYIISWHFSWVCSIPAHKCLDSISLQHDCFLPHSIQFNLFNPLCHPCDMGHVKLFTTSSVIIQLNIWHFAV